MVGMLVAFVLAGAWLIPAALSGDIRWFLAGVSEQPHEIVIWSNGQQTSITESDPDYAPLSAAVSEAISHIGGSSDFGPSATTVAEYRQSFSLEAFYAQPLQIHSRFNLGHPRQIMVPLTGAGYSEKRFFIGADGAYRAAGPITQGLSPVRATAEAALNHRGVTAPTTGEPIR